MGETKGANVHAHLRGLETTGSVGFRMALDRVVVLWQFANALYLLKQ